MRVCSESNQSVLCLCSESTSRQFYRHWVLCYKSTCTHGIISTPLPLKVWINIYLIYLSSYLSRSLIFLLFLSFFFFPCSCLAIPNYFFYAALTAKFEVHLSPHLKPSVGLFAILRLRCVAFCLVVFDFSHVWFTILFFPVL